MVEHLLEFGLGPKARPQAIGKEMLDHGPPQIVSGLLIPACAADEITQFIRCEPRLPVIMGFTAPFAAARLQLKLQQPDKPRGCDRVRQWRVSPGTARSCA